MVREGSPPLEVGSDLGGVRPERALDLLVEVRVPVVDVVHVLVVVVRAPPRVVIPRLLPAQNKPFPIRKKLISNPRNLSASG